MSKNWISGQTICIDEYMIKYTGQAIMFAQCMSLESIIHGVKVFLCTANGHPVQWMV